MISAKARKRTLIALVVIVLALLALFWFAAGLVMHHSPPDRKIPTASEYERIAASIDGPVEKVALKSSDGVGTVAWLLPARLNTRSDRWGVLLVHGGLDDKLYYLELAEMLRRNGFDALLIDLRGHGESEASPRGMTLGITEGRDVAAAARFLAEERNIDHIAAIGVSLGGGAVIMGAIADDRIGPLVIESSSYEGSRVFDTLLGTLGLSEGAVRSVLNRPLSAIGLWRMGAPWQDAVKGHLPTLGKAKTLAPRPTLFVYGDRDPFVKQEAVEDYSRAIDGKSQIVRMADTGHGVYHPHPERFSQLVLAFLEDWKSATKSPTAGELRRVSR